MDATLSTYLLGDTKIGGLHVIGRLLDNLRKLNTIKCTWDLTLSLRLDTLAFYSLFMSLSCILRECLYFTLLLL